jgi:hypothetical protein
MPSDPHRPTKYMAVNTMLRVHVNHTQRSITAQHSAASQHSTSQHHITAQHIAASQHLSLPILVQVDKLHSGELYRLSSHRIVGSEGSPCSKQTPHRITSRHSTSQHIAASHHSTSQHIAASHHSTYPCTFLCRSINSILASCTASAGTALLVLRCRVPNTTSHHSTSHHSTAHRSITSQHSSTSQHHTTAHPSTSQHHSTYPCTFLCRTINSILASCTATAGTAWLVLRYRVPNTTSHHSTSHHSTSQHHITAHHITEDKIE